MVSVEVELVSSDVQDQRIAAHSHIKRLGLAPDGTAHAEAGGFIGQAAAREAAGIVVSLIRKREFAGRAVMFAGPPGSGKTALALAIAHELGSNVPFSHLVGSEVFSHEVKKTEVLATALRRAIGVRIRETKEVYEGEVTQLEVVKAPAPLSGYGQTVSHVLVQLRSGKGTKKLRLDPAIYEQLEREGVRVGDVIYIEAHTGAVRRVGRCDVYASAADLEADEFVPIPRGDVHKKKDVTQDITLHDLDAANARPQGGNDVMALMSQFSKQRKTEITQKLRSEIDRTVQSYIDRGVAELVPGVLFVDEVHMLDIEAFSFLNRALESPLAPIVILATNRGRATVRGTNSVSPHGLPADLLDRCLIIPTAPYGRDEMRSIIASRAAVEGVAFASSDVLDVLADTAQSTGSVRYAVQLLAPSKILAVAEEEETLPEPKAWLTCNTAITRAHVQEAMLMFRNVRETTALLADENAGFLQ